MVIVTKQHDQPSNKTALLTEPVTYSILKSPIHKLSVLPTIDQQESSQEEVGEALTRLCPGEDVGDKTPTINKID